MQEQLTQFLETVVNLPVFLPFLGIFVYVDAIMPAAPSETIISIGAAWSGSTGTPNIWNLFWVTVVAAFLGDQTCYFAGRKFKNRVERIRPNSKAGQSLIWIKRSMKLYGGAAIIIARFIPWARWVLTLMLGSVRYNWFLFTLFDTIGVFVWAGMLVSVSYLGGLLFQGSPLIGMVAGIAAGLLVGWLVQKAQSAFMEWRDERRAFSSA